MAARTDTIPPLDLYVKASRERKRIDAEIRRSIQLQCRVLAAARRNRPTLAQLAEMPEAPF